MLTGLAVRNFAIIDRLALEFDAGLTVITGETGAGKSILVDALGLALGDRGGPEVLRPGADRCEISAEFDLKALPAACSWLEEQDLADEDQCLLRRVIGADGRSRGYINGQAATMGQLRELGGTLVDIHSQHEHQSLLRPETQQALLDQACPDQTLQSQLAETYSNWQQCDSQLRALTGDDGSTEQRIEWLQFQVQELSALVTDAEQLDDLDAEQRRLAHAGELLEGSAKVIALLENEDGLLDQLGTAQRRLDELLALDDGLAGSHELLANGRIQLEEATSLLRQHSDGLELDPNSLEELDNRLAALHDAARKHRCEPTELPEMHRKLEAELHQLEDARGDIEGLTTRHAELSAAYLEQSQALSKLRHEAAADLRKRINAAVQPLGLAQARMEITVAYDENRRWSESGLDRIEFRTSMNPGQPLKPLAKVASGGELSRVSLAIQVASKADTDASSNAPTLIFDEVDSGIGGAVAEIVGGKLRELGNRQQVLCITHLPQVAAHGHQQLQVSKSVTDGATQTQIEPLDAAARQDEIARMLGGVELTKQTRAHAAEMLDNAQNN